jgi:hypothetical protein
MKFSYDDIRNRIAEEPKWWDEDGVPRYNDFNPRDTGRYGLATVLFLIKCQRCARQFTVAQTYSQLDRAKHMATLREQIEGHTLHYGDPPNVYCCPAGPSMNSVPMKTLEYWERDDRHQWTRVAELEGVDLTPDWWEE